MYTLPELSNPLYTFVAVTFVSTEFCVFIVGILWFDTLKFVMTALDRVPVDALKLLVTKFPIEIPLELQNNCEAVVAPIPMWIPEAKTLFRMTKSPAVAVPLYCPFNTACPISTLPRLELWRVILVGVLTFVTVRLFVNRLFADTFVSTEFCVFIMGML
jgi:hypothetical protein